MNTKFSPLSIVLLASLFAGTAGHAQVPTNFTGVSTTLFDSNSIAPGSVLIASCGTNGQAGPFFMQIMNNDGSVQVFKKAGYITPGDKYYPYDFKVLANGLLLNAQYTGWFNYAGGGTVIDQILDENLNLIENVQMGNGYQAECHDFELLPNGHTLMLGYYTTLADVRAVRPAAAPKAEISGAVIQELDGDRNVIWQWRTWDHLNWSEFSDWGPLSTGSLIAGWEVNVVRLDPIDGNLLMATSGEQMKINRQTGDVMWRLGGTHNQFSFIGVDPQEGLRQLRGHDFHRLPNGNYILPNNGNADGSRTSQVHEYRLDEANKTATHIWQYIPSSTIATWDRGNVQRLPNGNTFIGWGTSNSGQNPDCTEVAPDGRKVFELAFTNSLIDSYRAYRFPYPPSAQKIESVELGLADGNTYHFSGTGITIDVGTRVGDGYNSATISREPYSPVHPLFQGKAPRLLPLRINLSQTFIQSMSGQISFDLASFAIPNPTNTTVYYRATQGEGLFVPLNTQYNWVTGQLVAELSDTGFGEFALGFDDVAEIAFPPLLVEPESLQPGTFVTRVPLLVRTGMTYNVNQQLPIALSWNPKGFAGSYALQVSTNANFATPDVDEPFLLEARYAFTTAKPSTTYYWRVNTWNNGGLSDWASSSFVTVAPAIHVTFPNGGEAIHRGLPYFVQWDDNVLEDVTIDLYKAGAFLKTVATNVPSTVSYQWQVALDSSSASDYSLRIRSSTNSALFDLSDLPFSIVDAPTIDPGSIVRLSDGRVTFTVNAPGAAQATILSSSNLVAWQALQSIPVSNGSAVFTDTTAAGIPARFYRVRVP